MNKSIHLIILTLLVFLYTLVLAGCSYNKTDPNKNKLLVAVSIVPQKTFVEAVCGDYADVVVMIPPGNSPANYEPSPKIIENFYDASIYFSIGVNTEKENIMPIAKEIENLKIVNLHEEVAKDHSERELPSGGRDPHIWLSPKRVKAMINIISHEMGLIDPNNKQKYENNAQNYINKLDELDKSLKEIFDSTSQKSFIVFHPAFGYLADDYGLNMYALEHEGKKATPQRINELIDLAKKENIKVLFYQAEISNKQAQAFVREIDGKSVMLSPLSPDYIENMKTMAKLIGDVY